MFKDVAVYANPRLSNYSIPVNSSDAISHTYLKDGKEVRNLTSSEFVQASEDLWSSHLAQAADGDHKDNPVFFSSDWEKPLGFATFLACSTHLKKLFTPGTLNASKMIKSLPRQGSNQLVCDAALYNIEVPEKKAAEYQEMSSRVTNVLVAGNAEHSNLFSHAQVTSVDPYNF